MRLVFELELFKPPISVSVFGSETRITSSIAPKIFTKKDFYVPNLSHQFQVSTFSRFKVIGFSTSGCRIRSFARKKQGGSPYEVFSTILQQLTWPQKIGR